MPATIEASYETIVARIERLPVSNWHHLARAVLGAASFFAAFNAVVIALSVTVLAGLWRLNPVNIGFLISCVFAGQWVGTILFGWAGERYGRIFTAKLTVLIIAVFGLASAFAWGFAPLLVFQFFQGLGIGGESPVATTYVNEIAKARGRGKFTMLYQVMFPVGFTTASLVSIWVIPHLGWRWMFVFGALPAFLIVLLIQYSVPESPRWLARHHRLEDADRILLRLEKQIFGGAEPPALLTAPASKFKASVNFGDLFQGIYLKRTVCVWVMWLCASVNAWGLLLWMPSLLHTAYRLSVAQSLRYSMIGNVCVVILATAGAYVVDRTGRKTLFQVSFLCTALALLLLGMMHGPTGRTVLILATAGNASITVAELALSMYSSEIYPTRMRTLGTGTAGSWARAAAMITSPVIGLLLSITHEASAVFLFLSGLAFLGAMTVFLFATETSGKVLEEISP